MSLITPTITWLEPEIKSCKPEQMFAGVAHSSQQFFRATYVLIKKEYCVLQ